MVTAKLLADNMSDSIENTFEQAGYHQVEYVNPCASGQTIGSSVRHRALVSKATGQSSFLAALLLVTLANFLLFLVVPAIRQAADADNRTKPFGTKLPELLQSTSTPDILLIGSSLTLEPAVRCDDDLSRRRTRFDQQYYITRINHYTKAEYLEYLLAEKGCLGSHIHNLGLSGSMMSDHCFVLEKILASGKCPRLVICAIAPRDFLDSSCPVDPAATAVRRQLDLLGPLLLPRQCGVAQECQRFWCQITSAFYQNLRDLKNYLATQLRTATPFRSTHCRNGELVYQPNYCSPPNTYKYLEIYRKSYGHPDKQVYKQQCQALSRMLLLSRTYAIPVVLVNMPLPEKTNNLLPEADSSSYLATITGTSRSCGATFWDLNTKGSYNDLADFEDASHLNGAGGKKFFAALVAKIVESPDLLARLKTKVPPKHHSW